MFPDACHVIMFTYAQHACANVTTFNKKHKRHTTEANFDEKNLLIEKGIPF